MNEKNQRKEIMMRVGGQTVGIVGMIWKGDERNGMGYNCTEKVTVCTLKSALYTRPEGLDVEPNHKKSYEEPSCFPRHRNKPSSLSMLLKWNSISFVSMTMWSICLDMVERVLMFWGLMCCLVLWPATLDLFGCSKT